MVAVRLRRLVAGHAVADVDALDEALLQQGLEHPVDAGDADAAPVGAHAVVDLLHRHAAALATEEVDDRSPGATAAEAGGAEVVEGVIAPGTRSRPHLDDTDSQRCATVVQCFRESFSSSSGSPRSSPAGCGGSADDAAETQVMAAFYPLAYAAEQVAGNSVNVRNLTPAGSEPHDIELSAGDVRAIEGADLVVYAAAASSRRSSEAIAGREGPSLDVLDGQRPTGAGDEMREIDPHTWLDPMRYADQARSIARALGGGARRRARSRHGWTGSTATSSRGSRAARGVRSSPATPRSGISRSATACEQIPLTGIAPEAEPTPRDLERLVRQVEASGATTVFFESLVSPKLAETVAREAGVATAVLNPVEGLTEEQRADGADYFSLMRDNLAALRKALGCR